MKPIFTTFVICLSVSLVAQTNSQKWKISEKFNVTVFNTVSFNDSIHGIAAGWEFDKNFGDFLNPSIKYTSNKGKSWQSATIDNLSIIPMNSAVANGDTSVMAGIENNGNGFFSISYDAGKNWTSKTIQEDLYAVHFLNGREGFVCGKKGFIAVTKNSGKTWQNIAFPTNDDLFSISFSKISGKLIGYVCGEKGLFAVSVDTGKTWNQLPLSNVYDFSDIIMLPSGKGWMCAIDGAILHTADTGNTWTTQYINGFSQFNSISALNDTTAIAGGVNGELMVFKQNSWLSYLNLNNESDEIFSEIKSVTIIDALNMWFCTDEGELVTTKREDNSTTSIYRTGYEDAKIYFQPNSDNLIVNIKELNPCHIYLYNSLGILIEDKELEGGNTILTYSNLPNGIYFCKLESIRHSQSVKLVK